MTYQCPNAQVSKLLITILDTFPTSPPVVSVLGPLAHPWVDQYRFVTGCTALNSWTDASSLVNVVLEIKDTLETGWQLNYEQQQQQQQQQQGQSLTSAASRTGSGTSDPSTVHWGQQQQQASSILSGNGGNGNVKVNDNSSPTSSSSASSSSSSSQRNLNRSGTLVMTLAAPTHFPKLKDLSQEQLARLLQDEVAFDLFKREMMTSKVSDGSGSSSSSSSRSNGISNSNSNSNNSNSDNLEKGSVAAACASGDTMRTLRDTIRKRTLELARTNLQREHDLGSLHAKVAAAQKELGDMCTSYQKRLDDMKKDVVSSADVVEALNSKADVLDDQSEELGQKFVDGEVAFTDFLKNYMEFRVSYHALKAKLECVIIASADGNGNGNGTGMGN